MTLSLKMKKAGANASAAVIALCLMAHPIASADTIETTSSAPTDASVSSISGLEIEPTPVTSNDDEVQPSWLSSYGFFDSALGVVRAIIDAVGVTFMDMPISSELFEASVEDPQPVDPRWESEPQTIEAAGINLQAKVPVPDWWSWDTELKKHNPQFISAYSHSMRRDIPLIWVPASDQSSPRPVLYALSGRDGAEDGANVLTQTDITNLASDLNINIVTPAEGANSNYLDWYDDSHIARGKQQWETFLTKELPLALEEAIGASHQRAIVGVSASGGTALLYAEHNPGMYDAVGSISGCAEVDSWPARLGQSRNVADLGTVEQMLGPRNGRYSKYNDALINSPLLKEQENIFVFNSGGFLGTEDFAERFRPVDDYGWRARITSGAIIEWATNLCNHRLQSKLAAENIPARVAYSNSGAHSWGTFNEGVTAFMDMLEQRVCPKNANSGFSSSSS
ncbi:alpha/beta hydrolase family protein [Corynebacterium sp. SCR221107]|uniref:alpha/beta hydrolase n=1 Tax=Corynebacterium sp. SCR221107 TaxID=3017361 RepID=UPI0022EC1BA3|nr:alpha/beta hydrolase family protein [Corynebacterium sp. SCR221107]WBT08108.1 alpha/beta hydrolase family protein [Corynebacterium sp. SCR221107]